MINARELYHERFITIENQTDGLISHADGADLNYNFKFDFVLGVNISRGYIGAWMR